MDEQRTVIQSVTNFLYYHDDFLLLHRSSDRRVDANKLNGIGGKVEKNENYLDAAIRETNEETGYIVKKKEISLAGIVSLSGGYLEDWIMCFFTIRVKNKHIPLGSTIPDGNLIWLHKDKVLTSEYTLVDDLHYCWKYITTRNSVFFASTQAGKDEKVVRISLSTLPNGA